MFPQPFREFGLRAPARRDREHRGDHLDFRSIEVPAVEAGRESVAVGRGQRGGAGVGIVRPFVTSPGEGGLVHCLLGQHGTISP